jgi:hypothetical protein
MPQLKIDLAKLKQFGQRKPVAVCLGAQDYLYERSRKVNTGRRSSTVSVDSLKAAVSDLKPSAVRSKVKLRSEAARDLPNTLASRGETIVADWHNASAVKDLNRLTVRLRERTAAAKV